MSDRIAGADEKWDIVISSNNKGISMGVGQLLHYWDLLMMFVKKDLITIYKQTILGPVWFVIQPILTTITYIIIFARAANFGTDSVPPILFYMGSVTMWNYFSETLNITSKTFTENANIFGKVYFPRIIVPASKVISGLVKFFVQLGLFLIIWCYHTFVLRTVTPNFYLLLLPVLLLLMALISLGLGLLVTAATTKYRDLSFLITFAVQLLMYGTPVIYPISKFKNIQTFLWLNPLSSLFETFKFGFFGKGTFSPFWFCYSIAFSIAIFFIGLVFFSKVEKKFIDTV